MMKKVFGLLLTAAALMSFVAEEGDKDKEKIDPTGKWEWKENPTDGTTEGNEEGDDEPKPNKVNVELTGKKLTIKWDKAEKSATFKRMRKKPNTYKSFKENKIIIEDDTTITFFSFMHNKEYTWDKIVEKEQPKKIIEPQADELNIDDIQIDDDNSLEDIEIE